MVQKPSHHYRDEKGCHENTRRYIAYLSPEAPDSAAVRGNPAKRQDWGLKDRDSSEAYLFRDMRLIISVRHGQHWG